MPGALEADDAGENVLLMKFTVAGMVSAVPADTWPSVLCFRIIYGNSNSSECFPDSLVRHPRNG